MTSIGSGESGVLGTEWQVQNRRRNALANVYGGSDGKLDMYSAMSLTGVDRESSLDSIQFSITGTREYEGSLLDWQASAWSAGKTDDRLFQSSNYDLYTNVDLEKGTYKIMDERTLTEDLGMDWSGGKPYDVLEIKNNNVNFYDFVFCGEKDGSQDSLNFQLNELTNARWGVNSYEIREVDTDLLKSAVNGSGTTAQSRLAYNTFQIMKDTLPGWATEEINAQLEGLEQDSDAYYEKFIELAIKTMDNEGYTEGNTIDTPKVGDQADTQLKTHPSTKEGFNVVRGDNGQVRVTLNNVKGFNVIGAGNVTGSGTFSVGETSDAQTVVQVGQTRQDKELNYNVSGNLTNYEFYGENVNANFNSSTKKSYNVQWNASNSKLDSTKGDGSLYINTSEDAANNNFKLGDAGQKIDGKYDNVVVDNGKNNVYKGDSNTTNMFVTSETSDGALIYGGDGKNTALIGGKNGMYIGGAGEDTITTSEGSKNNLLFGMDGDDTINEYGQHNTFLGGRGNDKYNSFGKDNLANLGYGEDYELNLRAGSNNTIFTGEELDGYNYNDFLNRYLEENGMTMAQLLDRLNMTANDATVEKIVAALTGNVLGDYVPAKDNNKQTVKPEDTVTPPKENDEATTTPNIPGDGDVTTKALNEEGGEASKIPNIPSDGDMTTKAIGEEGGNTQNDTVTELENEAFIDFTDKIGNDKKLLTKSLNETGENI